MTIERVDAYRVRYRTRHMTVNQVWRYATCSTLLNAASEQARLMIFDKHGGGNEDMDNALLDRRGGYYRRLHNRLTDYIMSTIKAKEASDGDNRAADIR